MNPNIRTSTETQQQYRERLRAQNKAAKGRTMQTLWPAHKGTYGYFMRQLYRSSTPSAPTRMDNKNAVPINGRGSKSKGFRASRPSQQMRRPQPPHMLAPIHAMYKVPVMRGWISRAHLALGAMARPALIAALNIQAENYGIQERAA